MTTNDTPEPVRANGGPVRDTGWTVSTDCPRPAIMALRGDHGPEVFGEEAGRIPAPAVETVTDRAAIRACDEPDERHDCGDGLCRQCSRDFGRTTPAPVSGAGLDLDAIRGRAEWAQQAIGTASTAYRSVSEDVPTLVAVVRRLTGIEAHRDNLAAMIRRLSEFLDGRNLNSWKHGACWAAEDAIKSLTARAESAEAEVVELRAKVAAVEAKRDEFADLLARALPAIAALGAAEEVGDRWYGYGHGLNNTHPGKSLPCDVCDVLREFRAALATTGEGQ